MDEAALTPGDDVEENEAVEGFVLDGGVTEGESDAAEVTPVSRRLAALDAAIDANPATPVNYLLRGELFLEQDRPRQAVPDFERAIALIGEQLKEDDWDSVSCALLERAESRLSKAIETAGKRYRPS